MPRANSLQWWDELGKSARQVNVLQRPITSISVTCNWCTLLSSPGSSNFSIKSRKSHTFLEYGCQDTFYWHGGLFFSWIVCVSHLSSDGKWLLRIRCPLCNWYEWENISNGGIQVLILSKRNKRYFIKKIVGNNYSLASS